MKDIAVVDLSQEPDPAVAVTNWSRSSFAMPYDLIKDRPFDLFLVKESESVTYAYVRSHHIVSDAWGLHLFMTQARRDYARMAESGEPATIASPSFLAMVDEDCRYQRSEQRDTDRAFFREMLTGAEPPLFTRKAPSGARATARHAFTLERSLITRIKDRGESPFVYVTAAIALYLSRVHQVDEVVLGIPLLNRPGRNAKQTVGQFANSLPLRVRVAPDRAARDMLAELREDTRSLLRHQRLPLGDVVRDLPRGGDSPPQLFDTTISYLRWPHGMAIPGLRYETVAQTHAHDQDALAIWIYELGDVDDIIVNVEHACDVFDGDFRIEAAARHIETLLRGLADTPEQQLAELAMLSPADCHDVVITPNATDAEFPVGATLTDLFAAQVARAPQQVATIDPSGETVSFAELDIRTNAVARALRGHGVKPDDRVAVVVERGPYLLPAILGVLKAGAAYVPVDPTYPRERIRLLLEDSGATVVIVGDTAADVPGLDVPGLAGDAAVRHVGELWTASGEAVDPVATAEHLAYVIYTSGSTGQPKGVMVEHRSVVNRLWWMQRRYPLTERDVLLQKTPISFDVSVWELLWWTFTGARLALLAPGAEKDPQQIARTIAERHVSVVHFVPSMLGPLLDLLEAEPASRDEVASLRLIFCSGEVLPPSRVAQFNRIFGVGVRLVNLYGPTEATVDVSAYDCPAGSPSRVPIGRPIDNIQLYVLGRDGQPQPAGAAGELCVGGVGVARGYLNRPDLTADRFVRDPFTPGGRLYRTGDLARWLTDGALEYLGRLDGQVKIRGNRVETGEVAEHLAAVPGISDAVVVHRTSDTHGAHLVGYYVAAEHRDPVGLRARLATALPEFMIPTYFVRIDAIPLTSNGKLDRRQLPEPRASVAAASDPRDPTEAALAGIWSEVLGVESVGVHDNYFAIGGDSILMLRVRASAERRGISFALADLVQNPTVAALAVKVSANPRGESVWATSEEIGPFELVSAVDRPRLTWAQDAYPCSKLSLGMLFHSDQHPDSSVYHDVFRYRFEMAWDEAAFRRAFDMLVERHPALRSSFDLVSYSEPLQIVRSQAAGGLEIVDLRSWDEAQAEARVAEHVRRRRFHRYDPARPPLYLFGAHVRQSTVDLVFSFHHAILDGWSVANLIVELIQDYLREGGLAASQPAAPSQASSSLPAAASRPAVPSPAAFAREERRALSSAATADYWKRLLDGAEMTHPDGFRAHEPSEEPDFVAHRVDVPDDLVELLRQTATTHSLPVKSLLLAAHCLTLRVFSGHPGHSSGRAPSEANTVTTGVVAHGRPELAEAERTVGLFLNTVPVRADVGQRSWLDVARAVFRQEQASHPHRRCPLSAIQQAHGGQLETAFNYVNLHVLEPLRELPGARLSTFQVWEQTNFTLFVNVITDPVGGGVYLRVDTDGRVISRAQAELLGDTYVRILRRMATRPDDPPDFSFLAPRRDVAPRSEPLADVVTRFARQVAERPQATAVALDDRAWTYQELDQRSRTVAAHLARAGATSGDFIGIAVDRSPEMIAIVLGVLRAGLVCVPLDVSYPRRRLAMITDTVRPFRVVAHRRHAHLVADQKIVVSVEEVTADVTPPPLASVAPSLEQLACVLFTSGSTGRPKGVELTHRMWANYTQWQLGVPSGARARTLQFAPLSFDMSFQEIFATLCGGGALQLVSEQDRMDMPTLLRLIQRRRVERVLLPFVALQRLAEASNALGLRPSALQVIVSSGEQLVVTEDVRRFCAALPGVRLENQYGPTETHQVTSFSMVGDPARFPDLPPIGRPLDGVEVQVLDAALRPAPVGASGEIYLGGDCLARGYHRAPELTDERFIPHPWREGARLYRTGDLGRTLPSGDVVWLGRADSQVKVRGFRIEPAEVELAVMRHAERYPGIRGVAVVARERTGADSFLAAFLTGDSASVNLDDLATQLRTELPSHLVPARFTWLDAMPLTPSGKRDDAALRTIQLAPRDQLSKVSPRDEHERALAEIWCELLGVSTAGIRDDFFEVGGTSLTAMRLAVTLEKRYGVAVPVTALVETPTIEGLAGLLRSRAAPREFDPLVPLRPHGDRRPIFLVHPLGGHVLCYLKLARQLPPDQPVYALQAAGTEQGAAPLASIADMAASYLTAVKRVQPDGPYLLGGWSFGGFVAFEMARQLRASDPDSVEKLIVLDSITIDRNHPARVSDDALLEFFFWELVWFERSLDEIETLPATLTTLDEKFEHIVQRATASGVLPWGTSAATVRRLFALFQANWRALLDYRPDVCEQDLTLLRADGPLPDALKPMHDAVGTAHTDPANGWRPWTTGRLNVVTVPGDHLVLMDEPHVAGVAKHVADLLSDDQPSTNPAVCDWTLL